MSSIQGKMDKEVVEMMRQRGVGGHTLGVCEHTLLKASRLKGVIRGLDIARKINGDRLHTAEIGCASGGTSRLIAVLNGNLKHWAVDTFVGLMDAGEKDPHLQQGDFSGTPYEIVADRLGELQNVQVVQGFFPECAGAMRDHTYSFVHIDVDTYASIHACFDFFKNRMAKGGVMALDDVIGKGTAGAKLAWQEIQTHQASCWKVLEQNDPQVIIQF